MIEITLDSKQFDRGIARMIRGLEQPRPLLVAWGRKLQEQTAARFRTQTSPAGIPWKRTGELALSTRPGGGGGGRTLSDSDQLLGSIINPDPRVDADSVRIGSNLPYANIHQYGGTISPRAAKNLAIPLTREARRSGRARRWWKQNEQRHPFILPGKRDSAVIATRQGKRVTAHWLLKKSVTIPARPYLGVSDQNMKELGDIALGVFNRLYGGRA